MTKTTFLILGGDERSLYLGEYLESLDLKVCYYAFRNSDCFDSVCDAISEADCIILPLPFTKDKVTLNAPLFDEAVSVTQIASLITADKTVFGGMLSQSFCDSLAEKGVEFFDYFALDEFAIYNAVPTAEGVLGILINELPCAVHGMKCAVIGYGRVGKVLARTLNALNCIVTVFARKEADRALAYAENIAFENIYDYKNEKRDFDAVINTVPSKVIGGEEFGVTNSDCLFIETASQPYGIDFKAAKEHFFDVIKAGSLPGKAAPKTAGEIIARTLIPIFKKKGLMA